MRIALNVVAFYAAWFGAVLSAARGEGAIAAAILITTIILHLVLVQRKSPELTLMGISAGVGLLVETLLMQLGFSTYSAPGPIGGLPPLWLVLMWAAFATLFNVSLAWLKHRLGWAALLAAVGGSASYYAGARLDGMMLGDPLWVSLAVIAALWALAFPLLLVVARRFDGEARFDGETRGA